MNRFEEERKRFPVTEKYAYLDHASRGPLSPPARELIDRELEELKFLNPEQLKTMHAKFQTAREGIASLLRTTPEAIAFVASTSMGVATAAGSLPFKPGDNVICAKGEFPANVFPWLNLTFRDVEVRFLEAVPGGITADHVKTAMDSRTRAVALSWVGFCDGSRVDTQGIGSLCKENGTFFALDAIQGVGALQVDLEGIDILVCGSAKWTLAPQGGGFIYVRPDLIEQLHPDRVGWLSVAQNADLKNLTALTDYRFELAKDARRFETGSSSPLTHLALGASCAYFKQLGPKVMEERIIELCDYMIEGLRKKGMETAIPIIDGRRSGIVCFPAPDPEKLIRRLHDADVLVSTREGNIRAGIHFYNNEEDVDRLLDVV